MYISDGYDRIKAFESIKEREKKEKEWNDRQTEITKAKADMSYYTPLSQLNLSVRAQNCLCRNMKPALDIEPTIGMAFENIDDLTSVQGCGIKTVTEILSEMMKNEIPDVNNWYKSLEWLLDSKNYNEDSEHIIEAKELLRKIYLERGDES